MNEKRREPRLTLVGVGPGDPDLLTVRAVRVLAQAPVWLAPKGRENGRSTAVEIAAQQVDASGKTVLEVHFPMQKVWLRERVAPELAQAWRQAAGAVLAHLDAGRDVAFPTLGDPSLYSTAYYLLSALEALRPGVPVRIVPGVPAMAACSAQVRAPLGLGDDLLGVVPAAFDDRRLRQVLATFDTVVLMKVHRQMDRILPLLEELGLLDRCVLVERCGLEGERVYHDVRRAAAGPLHYFSTLLVRKRGVRLPGEAGP